MYESNFNRIWKDKLYNLQNEAPDPIPVCSNIQTSKIPTRYSSYYHGSISRDSAEKILMDNPSGSFLVRDSSSPGAFALSIKYKENIKNYMLHYDEENRLHYVGKNKFETVESLVKDGLIHFHIESEGKEILDEIAQTSIYETTPYRQRYRDMMQCTEKANEDNSPVLNIEIRERVHRPVREKRPKDILSQSFRSSVDEVSIQLKSCSDEGFTLNWRNNSPNFSQKKYFEKQVLSETSNCEMLQKKYKIPEICIASDKIEIPTAADKAHIFKLHTFIGANWCDFCNNFLWGLIGQGFRCTDCGFQAHKRCSEIAPADCLPTKKFMRRVFAVDLIALVRAENGIVPIVLVKCIEEIEKRNGLSSEGIYRIPGNLDHMEELRKAFDKNANAVNLSLDDRVMDVNVLASLVKSFMRQLPNPLIPFSAYNSFIETARLSIAKNKPQRENNLTYNNEQIDRYRKLVHDLPLEHYNTLKYLMGHFHRVVQNHKENLMNSENLSMVLAPSLIYSSYTEFPMKYLRLEQAAVNCLIAEYPKIFPNFS